MGRLTPRWRVLYRDPSDFRSQCHEQECESPAETLEVVKALRAAGYQTKTEWLQRDNGQDASTPPSAA